MMDVLSKLDDAGFSLSGVVDRMQLDRAEEILAPARRGGVGMRQALLEVPAQWTAHPRRSAETTGALRARTMRRHGEAQRYPWPQRLKNATEGKLTIYPTGLVLEPRDMRRTCLHISADSMRAAEFYHDTFVLDGCEVGELLVRSDGIDAIDSIFGAYFRD